MRYLQLRTCFNNKKWRS